MQQAYCPMQLVLGLQHDPTIRNPRNYYGGLAVSYLLKVRL
jgi:hypothetical protein